MINEVICKRRVRAPRQPLPVPRLSPLTISDLMRQTYFQPDRVTGAKARHQMHFYHMSHSHDPPQLQDRVERDGSCTWPRSSVADEPNESFVVWLTLVFVVKRPEAEHHRPTASNAELAQTAMIRSGLDLISCRSFS